MIDKKRNTQKERYRKTEIGKEEGKKDKERKKRRESNQSILFC